MKYFLDTEFVEGTQQRTFLGFKIGETKPTIDLISIGIVAEDGREYYAISKDFNLKEAWNRYQFRLDETTGISSFKEYWLRENVLYPIFADLFQRDNPEIWAEDFGNMGNFMGNFERYGTGLSLFKDLLDIHGKTNKEIAEEVREFCTINETRGRGIIDRISPSIPDINREIEFYAYYADYDWVVFCWLFGKMMDLQDGFPKYCKDLKQDFDFYNNNLLERIKQNAIPKSMFQLSSYKEHPDYPKQENEHSAIDDARWNKKLYEFLNTL